MARLRYLLLQTRNSDDAMRAQEVGCFARRLGCDANDIGVVDLLARTPTGAEIDAADMILLGGSGHYSAAGNEPWLETVCDALRDLYHASKPTFASCWGFQAMARAMGGRCVHDPAHAELGTIELRLTVEGRADPIFNTLPQTFHGQAGHEDHVVDLPDDAVLLASSSRVRHQAFHFTGKPIYCTQFHPELDCKSLMERVQAYPEYVERIARVPYEEFVHACRETPEANQLLLRFVRHVF